MRSFNHLLFMDDLKLYIAKKDQLGSLTQAVRIFSQYIKMSFKIEKCAVMEKIDPFSHMKREYNTILDDADSANHNNFVPSQSFT